MFQKTCMHKQINTWGLWSLPVVATNYCYAESEENEGWWAAQTWTVNVYKWVTINQEVDFINYLFPLSDKLGNTAVLLELILACPQWGYSLCRSSTDSFSQQDHLFGKEKAQYRTLAWTSYKSSTYFSPRSLSQSSHRLEFHCCRKQSQTCRPISLVDHCWQELLTGHGWGWDDWFDSTTTSHVNAWSLWDNVFPCTGLCLTSVLDTLEKLTEVFGKVQNTIV